MTHRQFLAWCQWLDDDWNRPSRTDYQLMKVAQEVVRGRARNPSAVKLDDQRVRFAESDPEFLPGEVRHKSVEEAAAAAKARWRAMGWGKSKQQTDLPPNTLPPVNRGLR